MKRINCFIRRVVLLLFFFSAGISELHAGDFVETSGTAMTVALPIIAGGLTLRHDDAEGRKQLSEAMAVTLGTAFGLKYSVDATRPNGEKHSFPSAHTAVSFAAADFIGRRYGWNYGVPACLAAGYVGYSRVEAKEHHRYDVLAGAAIGVLGNVLFTSRFNDGDTKIAVSPLEDGAAFRVSCTW